MKKSLKIIQKRKRKTLKLRGGMNASGLGMTTAAEPTVAAKPTAESEPTAEEPSVTAKPTAAEEPTAELATTEAAEAERLATKAEEDRVKAAAEAAEKDRVEAEAEAAKKDRVAAESAAESARIAEAERVKERAEKERLAAELAKPKDSNSSKDYVTEEKPITLKEYQAAADFLCKTTPTENLLKLFTKVKTRKSLDKPLLDDISKEIGVIKNHKLNFTQKMFTTKGNSLNKKRTKIDGYISDLTNLIRDVNNRQSLPAVDDINCNDLKRHKDTTFDGKCTRSKDRYEELKDYDTKLIDFSNKAPDVLTNLQNIVEKPETMEITINHYKLFVEGIKDLLKNYNESLLNYQDKLTQLKLLKAKTEGSEPGKYWGRKQK